LKQQQFLTDPAAIDGGRANDLSPDSFRDREAPWTDSYGFELEIKV